MAEQDEAVIRLRAVDETDRAVRSASENLRRLQQQARQTMGSQYEATSGQINAVQKSAATMGRTFQEQLTVMRRNRDEFGRFGKSGTDATTKVTKGVQQTTAAFVNLGKVAAGVGVTTATALRAAQAAGSQSTIARWATQASTAMTGLGKTIGGLVPQFHATGAAGQRAMTGLNSGADALLGRYLGIAAAAEGIRRSFVGFAQLDDMQRRIAIDAGVSVQKMKEMQPLIAELQKRLGGTQRELLEGYNTIREFGNLTVDQPNKVFPQIAKAAKAMGVDTKDIAKTQATLMENLGMGTESMTKTNDMLMRAAKDYKLELRGLLPQLGIITEAQSQLGLSGEQGLATSLALIGALRNQGMSQEMATKQTARFYDTILKSDVQEKLTGDTEGISKMVQESLSMGKNPLAGITHLLIAMKEKMGAGFVEGLLGKGPRGAAIVFRTLEKYLDSLGIKIDDLTGATGDMDEAFQTVQAGALPSLEKLAGALDGLLISIGDVLEEFGASDAIKQFADDIFELGEEVRNRSPMVERPKRLLDVVDAVPPEPSHDRGHDEQTCRYRKGGTG